MLNNAYLLAEIGLLIGSHTAEKEPYKIWQSLEGFFLLNHVDNFRKNALQKIFSVLRKHLSLLFPSPCGSGSSTMEIWRSSRASEKVNSGS